MSQILRPDGDIEQSGDWEPEPSDTTLWDTMDEASPNDADYAWHNTVGSGEYFEVALSDPGGTPGTGTGSIRWRGARIDGGQTPVIKITLKEGAAERAFGSLRSLTDSYQLFEEEISTLEMASITNWTNLSILFVVHDATGGGKASDPAISWAELEVPDAAGGVPLGWNRIEYASEPPTPNAWNQVKREAGAGWKKILYE